jgi:hypothetical protein
MFGTLRVYDYKNGRTPVSAENNPQLMYYALGALGASNDLFVDKVVITIIQPNAMNDDDVVKKWTITAEELYDWANDVLRPGAERTTDANAPLLEGDHCAFCEAAAFCPVKQQRVLAMFNQPADAPTTAITLPEPTSISPERIGLLSAFFNGPVFEAWRKSLAAEEQSMLARGVIIPGRHLVERRSLGNRRWTDEGSAINALRDVVGDEMFNAELKSPAAIEKLLTSQGWSKAERTELLGRLVTRDEKYKIHVVSDGEDSAPAIAERQEKSIELFK